MDVAVVGVAGADRVAPMLELRSSLRVQVLRHQRMQVPAQGACAYVRIGVCVYLHLRVCACMYAYMSVSINACACAWMESFHVCMYTCVKSCIFGCLLVSSKLHAGLYSIPFSGKVSTRLHEQILRQPQIQNQHEGGED